MVACRLTGDDGIEIGAEDDALLNTVEVLFSASEVRLVCEVDRTSKRILVKKSSAACSLRLL